MKILITFITILFCLKLNAEEYRCPDRIDTKQVLSGESYPEWQSIDDTTNGQKTLEDMHVFDGNPSNVGSSLAPDNKGSKHAPYWTTTNTKQLWLSCRYQQTTIRLIKGIPAHLKKCTLRYRTLQGNAKRRVADSLICK